MCGSSSRAVEPGVAAEDLAGQGDGGVPPYLPEQQVQRGVHVSDTDRRVAGHDHGLAVLGVEQRPRVQYDRAVVGADERTRVGGERGAVAGAQDVAGEPLGPVAVADGVGAQAVVGALAQAELVGEQGGQDGGVDASGQRAAQRDVGPRLAAGGPADQGVDPVHGRVPVVLVRTGGQLPVAAFADAVPVEDEQAPRLDLPHAGPHRRPGQASVDGGPEQRFDAEPLPDEDQPLGALVPDGEGEHAVQVIGETVTPLGVGAQHDLGVTAGAEPVPASPEFGAQLVVVVDLTAVTEHRRRCVDPVGHRLDATREIRDRRPTVADRGTLTQPHAARVGATGGGGDGHRLDDRCPGAGVVVEGRPTGDSAHAGTTPRSVVGGQVRGPTGG